MDMMSTSELSSFLLEELSVSVEDVKELEGEWVFNS